MSDISSRVLVTGASGYVGSWVTKSLLEAGYKVRGTVRSLKDELKVQPLRELCPQAKHNLELVEADLLVADSWGSVIAGCDYVQHVASPFPYMRPSDPDVVIKPALEGTLNVLKACQAAKCVKRVVLTSSVAAVEDLQFFIDNRGKALSETYWHDPESELEGPYEKSKVLAEKAAWDFMKDLPAGDAFELAVINPGLVMGPLLTNVQGTSCTMLKFVLGATMPLISKNSIPVCDVRDVASAHVKAMTLPDAAGQRHIVVTKCLWLLEMADCVRKEFQPQGFSIPFGYAPYFVLKLASFFDSSVKPALPSLGVERNFDNTRMREVLHIQPTPVEKTLIDMGYSMIEKGMIPKTAKYSGPPVQTEEKNNQIN